MAGKPKDFKYPPIPEANLDEIPYADPKCRICQLPLENLKVVHQLRFGSAENRLTWRQLRVYLKTNYGIGNDYGYIMRHFKNHCRSDKVKLLSSESTNPSVVDIVLTKGARLAQASKNDETIERAFDKLVRQASEFTDKIDILFRSLKIKFENEEQVVKDLSELKTITLLRTLADMNAMARAQIKDIAALRAPKTLVMQFLEDTLDKATTELNELIRITFSMLQEGITKALVEKKMGHLIKDITFTVIFKEVAIRYKEQMMALRREQVARALAVLADMEKII